MKNGWIHRFLDLRKQVFIHIVITKKFKESASGWSDTYASSVEGQSLNINDVPDGRYAIQATLDPLNNSIEENKNNNSSIIYVEIEGMDIKVIDK